MWESRMGFPSLASAMRYNSPKTRKVLMEMVRQARHEYLG
jgi:hypothetical protein